MNQKFHDLIRSAIALNKEMRAELPASIKASTHPALYAQEFCTIHLSIGRRTGKTHFIQNFPGMNAIVVSSKDVREHLFGALPRVFVPEDLLLCGTGEFAGAEKIFVDEPQIVFRHMPRETLYRAFRPAIGEATYVLLGA